LFFTFWELACGIIAHVLEEISAICGISFGFHKRPPPEHIMGLKNSSTTKYENIARGTPGFATCFIPSNLPIKYFYAFPVFATNCTTSDYSIFETQLF